MKHHIVFKFLAVLLCSCFLVAAMASAAAVIGIAATGLYSTDVAGLQQDQKEAQLQSVAYHIARQYAARTLGGLTDEQVDIFCPMYEPSLLTGDWYYTVSDAKGSLLESNVPAGIQSQELSYWVTPNYPVVLEHMVNNVREQEPAGVTTPESEPSSMGVTTPTHRANYDMLRTVYYTDELGNEHRYEIGECWGDSYQVTILLTEGAYETDTGWIWDLAELGYRYRYGAISVLFASLLLFAAVLTYLCCAAGRSPGTDAVRPGGLNCLPLDLYAFGVVMATIIALSLGQEILSWGSGEEELIPIATAILAMGMAVSVMLVGFLFAFAAQVKTKGGFWWRRSLIGMMLRFCVRIMRWMFRGIGRFLKLLPLTWQWLLVAAGMGIMLLFAVAIRSGPALLFAIAACIGIVIYGACCFGKLFDGARRMSRGDLGSKVSSVMMVGSFREFAGYLNALADVAVQAARRQMTSERMKAELITNVSHDIKTPLTSIINYVDLLQSAQTEEQRQQYLEVLSRQSQRMKKLIEDLMEMSKASSGAMACELTRVDAAEAVNQALGEFSDKFEQARLVPVVRYPEIPAAMLADGRLTWRVMSNLLSNAVKYAMPGTRLYVDIVRLDGRVLISLKNISREALNIGAGELMERFVRGDTSRNTEGSGLGLNIAKSLMELQHGQLQLLIDGDLFKATMIFPEAK